MADFPRASDRQDPREHKEVLDGIANVLTGQRAADPSIMGTITATGDITAGGNLKWKSGTAFTMELDHAATANRTITFPDATDTAALLARTQTFTGQNTFNNGTAPIITALIGPSSTQQHTLPAVTSDTIALLARSQTFSGTLTLSNAAPLIFSGTAARITGDFANATLANRVLFQNSTVNAATNVGAIPNGSSTSGAFSAYNNSAPGSASVQIALVAGAAEAAIRADSPSGSYQPMIFYTNGAEQFRITTGGNWRFSNGQVQTGSGGAAATLRTIATVAGTGPGVAAQSKWVKVEDNAGAVIWFAGWSS